MDLEDRPGRLLSYQMCNHENESLLWLDMALSFQHWPQWVFYKPWHARTQKCGVGARESSVVNSTWCSCREPRFGSHPQGSSQPSLTPILEYLIPSSDLESSRHTWGTYPHTQQNIHTYKHTHTQQNIHTYKTKLKKKLFLTEVYTFSQVVLKLKRTHRDVSKDCQLQISL